MHGQAAKPTDLVAQGVLIIVASVATMAFCDAVVKLVSSNLTLWQVFAARSLCAVPCLLILGYFRSVSFAGLFNKRIALRSTLLVLAWLAFYSSLPVLKLSTAAVAIYTNPILTAVLSAFVFKETVSARQWLGVVLGFIGVAVILRPGTDAFTWFLILPLLGAALYSTAMVITRAKCQKDEAINLALGLHVALIATGGVASVVLVALNLDPVFVATYPFLLENWAPMGQNDWALMALLGVLSAAFMLGVARAYQIAPPQIIGTFDYAYLVSAAIWGFVFFAETPDSFTAAGTALIIIAGLLVAGGKPAPPDGGTSRA